MKNCRKGTGISGFLLSYCDDAALGVTMAVTGT
jgi:hypothetical protein